MLIDYRYHGLRGYGSLTRASYVVYPIIEFEVDGRKYRVRSRAKLYGNSKRELKNKDIKGLEVKVLYDDIDPTDAVVLLDKETIKDITMTDIKVHFINIFFILVMLTLFIISVITSWLS